MVTMGIMANQDELGVEASGIVRRSGPGAKHFKPGDRVMIMRLGLFRTRTILPADRCTHMPLSLSLEDAASMPVVFGTAIHCLMDIGRLEKGQVRGTYNRTESDGADILT
jgi:NADPH:quinone reductase-like Zn-dependent oxidoreductase